nr:unnamed protein product [Callosobruchus analis]
MNWEEDMFLLAAANACFVLIATKKKKKKRGGEYSLYTRVETDFEILLNKVGELIQKKDTTFRCSISAKERLAVTFRFLASRDSYQSLSYLFKISPQIISTIIPEVCDALIVALSEHLKMILMALCDANCCITYVNIGSPGRMSDEGIFQNCKLSEYMENGNINFPPDNVLPSTQKKQPHVIVADNAFPLKNNLMVPYPGLHDKGSEKRIFNYRLSRARRLIENVFGIMAAVFRILKMPMMLCQDKANKIIKTCVLLHNFLRRSATSRTSYSPQGTFDDEQNGKFIPGSWRSDNEGLVSLKPLHSVPRRSQLEAETVRQAFSHYFLNTDKVSWQNEY